MMVDDAAWPWLVLLRLCLCDSSASLRDGLDAVVPCVLIGGAAIVVGAVRLGSRTSWRVVLCSPAGCGCGCGCGVSPMSESE